MRHSPLFCDSSVEVERDNSAMSSWDFNKSGKVVLQCGETRDIVNSCIGKMRLSLLRTSPPPVIALVMHAQAQQISSWPSNESISDVDFHIHHTMMLLTIYLRQVSWKLFCLDPVWPSCCRDCKDQLCVFVNESRGKWAQVGEGENERCFFYLTVHLWQWKRG